MGTLTQVQAGIDALSLEQKWELLRFLVARLRVEAGDLPLPRKFPPEQIAQWVSEDEGELGRAG